MRSLSLKPAVVRLMGPLSDSIGVLGGIWLILVLGFGV